MWLDTPMSGIANHKNRNFSEKFLFIEFCRALFADHFARKRYKISLINNGNKVKILKNILPISTGAF